MRCVIAAAAVMAAAGGTAAAADFDGDGTEDVAVFRESSGMWGIRGVTRVFFGNSDDRPVPGDYDGSGTDRTAIFRSSSGLWAARGLTRLYFGTGDDARPGDYNGDGTDEPGIFRGSSGLWAARGVTRLYFGKTGDTPVSPGTAGTSGGEETLLWTGQTESFRTGDDGYYRKGARFSYQTLDPAGNGEIVTVDLVTGLMWAADGYGKGCGYGNETPWNSAIDWAQDLTFAGYSDWRLPNRRELESLIDIGRYSPAIDPVFFPHTRTDGYWTGSTPQIYTYNAWGVVFHGGYLLQHDKTENGYVRAVRGGR
ncbi:MAG TPA: DUF1566 domain-containing protein [bacterium]|nr:DUF1566 domain-containing protein [bacterium]HPQ71996.1 DUF1566 domain-containing protein [bacterium]